MIGKTICLSLRILLLIAVWAGLQVVSASDSDSSAFAFYLAKPQDTAVFSDAVLRSWQNENITLVTMQECAIKKSVSQQLACMLREMESSQYRDKKIAWILKDEFGQLASMAPAQSTALQSLSSLVLLGTDEWEPPQLDRNEVDWNILIVNLSSDSSVQIQQSRHRAQQFRQAGIPVWFTLLVPPPDQQFQIQNHPVLAKMTAYQLYGEVEMPLNIQFKAESVWQDPPLDNDGYFTDESFAVTLPVDPLLFRTVETFYQSEPFFLKQWPFNRYKAFDLMRYRDSLPSEKQGRYVSFTNPKGHQFFIDLNRYGRYQPVIVFQIDDETNLYRMARFYKTRQFYSWLPEQGGPTEEQMYVEPLGAFLHFLKPLPSQYEIPRLQYTAIRFESIQFTNNDPFAGLTGMSFALYRVVSRNCISCHEIDGIGGSAGHLDAFTLEKRKGYALPLRTYTPAVLREFFFNQQDVANLIGVRPNFIQADVAQELMDWLQAPLSN